MLPRAEIQKAIDNKTKPLGSLGRLEDLALQICELQETLKPSLENPTLFLFAGDHGITVENISAYPKEVTWQMVINILQGGAASSVFCRELGVQILVIDSGVDHEFDEVTKKHPQFVPAKVLRGTKNSKISPAMSMDEVSDAIERGKKIVTQSIQNGTKVCLFGEMGIGNTIASSLILSSLTKIPIQNLIGAGTGLSKESLAHKVKIAEIALNRVPKTEDPFTILMEWGGFEIAMLVGGFLTCAKTKTLCLVDGWIATAAYLLAETIDPTLKNCSIFSHLSDEIGHKLVLEHAHKIPLMHLNMRLGEGTGALVAFPVVRLAVSMVKEMATFESGKVSR